MINAVIIDDEPGNVRVLRELLQEYCWEVTILGEAGQADEAYTLIRQVRPDLVFLDIEMPYGNAFDLLDKLMPVSFEVIFVTAFNDYTLKAFKYSVLDYLLKPVNLKELQTAVQKAGERLQLKRSNLQLNNLLSNLRQPDPAAIKLAIPSMDSIIFVRFDNIIRIEAEGGYSHFYMKDGQKILSSKNIKEYEDTLPGNMFMRVHHSHIISLACIIKYHRGRGGLVEMEDGQMIEVASRRKEKFLAAISG
jgi:two-component system LytT family response regulator